MTRKHKILFAASLALLASGPLYANPQDDDRTVVPEASAELPPEVFAEPSARAPEPAPVAQQMDRCAQTPGLADGGEANISLFYPFSASLAPAEGKSLRATSEGGVMLVDGTQYTLQYIELPKQAELPFSGINYPMEARFVHKAADGGVAVLLVPVAEGESNIAFEKMLRDSTAKIDPNDLLPSDRGFALVSQTPEGCDGPKERRYVMKTPLQISATQIEKFGQLF